MLAHALPRNAATTILALLVAAGSPPASVVGGNPADMAAYEAAKAQVGRDPDAHVRLALWCETHGLKAERLKHLAIAVIANPRHSMARGLMGLVDYHGRWQRPESIPDKVRADAEFSATLAEYNTRRAKLANTADAHWKLALWCEEKGLKAEATAHLSSVVRLDPSREAAWKRLGCKKHNGRWMTEVEIAEEKAENQAQKQADKRWRPLLEKWQGWLSSKSKRQVAEDLLAGVTDPRAVPAVCAVFAAGEAPSQVIAVRVLGQIDSGAASRALAMLAVFGESAEIRRVAIETLKQRDPREFARLLTGLLQETIAYEVRPVGGPGSPGALFVKGKKLNVQRLYAPPAMPNIPLFAGEPVAYDAEGLPVVSRLNGLGTLRHVTKSQLIPALSSRQFADYRPSDPAVAAALTDYRANPIGQLDRFFRDHPYNRQAFLANPDAYFRQYVTGMTIGRETATSTPVASETLIPVGQIVREYQRAAISAQQQLAEDAAAIEAHNADVKKLNDSVVRVLDEVSGLDLGADIDAWKAWWIDLQGYAYLPAPDQPAPTIVQNVPLAYQPKFVPVPTLVSPAGPTTTSTDIVIQPISKIASCFGAGTQVRTFQGPQSIESLHVGDRVLAQDLKTGALSYQPILVVLHNPPSSTFRIRMTGDAEPIVSSPFHRFWKAGQGWVMARDLKAGDTLRMLDGLAQVESVEAGTVQPVFNLEVAADHDFFVGHRGTLVHDNTIPRLRLDPFDAEPSLSSLAR
ncbi:polymorphic toxin-type HINT domain-containing protein [Singulisphaera sp. Ch08]|uniref:Polymorphic toxin-type HINT domain-containing protein n=1 Tax=Singulisphaera sp. Ch08 TaxID=3120278 RepID=A0AAU7C8U2_9BACT